MNMRGSGIYTYEVTRYVECDATLADDPERTCAWDGWEDVTVDDWGHGHWVCPECGAEHEYSDPEPDDFDGGDWMRDEI